MPGRPTEPDPTPGPGHGPGLGEFVALVALMTSLVALSVDAMLPALPAIGADLGVADPNDPQLVVSTLLLGLGLGQLVYGPVSDSVGRKPAIYAGFALFMCGCLLSVLATTFHWMLAGRLLQGIGAAGPRIVTVALVRDRYAGAEMARVMSFVMSVFILVPAVAPAIGQGIMLVAGWRAIFATFLAIAAVALAWFALRLPETLAPGRRVPLSLGNVAGAVAEVCTTRVAIGYTVAAGFVFAAFIGYLSSAQQVFQGTYGVGRWFPACFAALALAIGCAALVNARLVMRYGMRRLVRFALTALTLLSFAFLLVAWALDGVPPLGLFLGHFAVAFFCIGILFGNLNAIAMEPLGHIAGVGAAVVGSIATFISVPIGALVGLAYDGTVLALAAGFAVLGAAALATLQVTERDGALAPPAGRT